MLRCSRYFTVGICCDVIEGRTEGYGHDLTRFGTASSAPNGPARCTAHPGSRAHSTTATPCPGIIPRDDSDDRTSERAVLGIPVEDHLRHVATPRSVRRSVSPRVDGAPAAAGTPAKNRLT